MTTGRAYLSPLHGWVVEWSDGRSTRVGVMPDEATARACAAAPDLLEALRDLADWMEERGKVPPELDRARAAIARATDGASG